MELNGRRIVLVISKMNGQEDVQLLEGIANIRVIDLGIILENTKGHEGTETLYVSDESIPQIPHGTKNLRDISGVAELFSRFLASAHEEWAEMRREMGRPARKADFARYVGLDISTLHKFRKDPVKNGLLVSRAKKVCTKLKTSLVAALRKGAEY